MPSQSLSSLIELHLQELKAEGRYSASTLQTTESWLRNLEAFWGQQSLARLCPERLTDWRRNLTWNPTSQGKIYSENTVNQAIGAIRRFFAWAAAQGLLPEDPSGHLITRRVPLRRRSLNPVQARRLLGAPDLDSPMGIRDRAVLGVLVETRITRPACSRIDLVHLQLDTGALLTQGRQRQIHCLTDGLLGDLERYLNYSRPLLAGEKTSSALFLNQQGERLSGPSIQQLCRRHCQAAGVPLP